MSENNIQDLRRHLFETIQLLKDRENPMDIQRAKAISNAAQVVVNSVKVELEFMKETGDKGTGFIPAQAPALPDKSNGGGSGVVQTVRHRSGWQNSK